MMLQILLGYRSETASTWLGIVPLDINGPPRATKMDTISYDLDNGKHR